MKLRFLLFFIIFSVAAGAEQAKPEEPSESAQDAIVPEEYVIEKGDTLWDISRRYFKDPFKWPAIWEKNDYIANPDLIFPGNKLKFILQKIKEKELPKVEEPVEEEEVPVQPPPKEPEVEATPSPPPPPPKEYKLKAMDKNKDFFESAGFIIEKGEEPVGHISHSFKEKNFFTEDDKVAITFTGYSPTIGERFIAYSIMEKVKHPKTKKEVGNLIKIRGHLKIVEDKGEVYTAVITKSFDVITLGNTIRKYEEFPIPLIDLSVKPQVKNINGYIVAAEDKKGYVGANSFIYIDRGKKDGVVAGDLFEIYKEVPAVRETEWSFEKDENIPWTLKEKIGEFRIVVARPKTSAGWIYKTSQEIKVGEPVRYSTRDKKD